MEHRFPSPVESHGNTMQNATHPCGNAFGLESQFRQNIHGKGKMMALSLISAAFEAGGNIRQSTPATAPMSHRRYPGREYHPAPKAWR
jgi:hypothetical protein